MRTSNRLVWTVIFVIGLTLQPAFGQPTGNEQRQALAQLGITPYPSEEEVKDGVFSPDGFEVAPLSAEDIHADFSNIGDLDWLAPIAREHRVLLLGEIHYYQYLQHLRNRLLFALNTVDAYPTLILERQYSTTPFLNHYLNIAQDEDADAFARDIQDMLVDDTDRQLLRHLRRWNTMHPDRKIRVGCSDIEHHYRVTFRQILFPYFARVETAVAAEMPERPADSAKELHHLLAMFDETRASFLSRCTQSGISSLEDCWHWRSDTTGGGNIPFNPDYMDRGD